MYVQGSFEDDRGEDAEVKKKEGSSRGMRPIWFLGSEDQTIGVSREEFSTSFRHQRLFRRENHFLVFCTTSNEKGENVFFYFVEEEWMNLWEY